MNPSRTRVLRLMAVAALAIGGLAVTTSAEALDSRCSLTALTPYESGSQIAYGGYMGCGDPIGERVEAAFQRQGTATWATLATGTSITYAGRATINLVLTNGSCVPSGKHTFRSRVTGWDNMTGNATINGTGKSLTC